MKIKIEVSAETVSNILCNAFEGGSNYWYMIEKFIEPKVWTIGEKPEGNKHHYAQDYPLNEGGALIISDARADEPQIKKPFKRLDLAAIEAGMEIMARDFPTHFMNMITENDDAETGDVLLQCCIFGEIVYG